MIFHPIQSWDCLLTCLISEGKSVKVSQCNQTSPSLSGFSLFNQLDASQNHQTGKKRWFFATDWARYMFYSQVCVCVCLRACTCMQGIEYIYIYLHIISYTCICLHICNYILILIYKLLHTPVSHPYARCWSYSFVTHNIKSTFIPVSWIHAPHNMKFYILPSTGGVLAGFVGACASLAEASSAFWAARRRPRCNVCPKHPEKISTQLPPAFLVRNHE